MWTRMVVVAAVTLVACASDESAPAAVGDGDGSCTSYTSRVSNGFRADDVVDYRPDGLVQWRRSDLFLDGAPAPIESTSTDYDYLDGRLMVEVRSWTSEQQTAPSQTRTIYTYDDHGSLIFEEETSEGVVLRAVEHQYDELQRRTQSRLLRDSGLAQVATYSWEGARRTGYDSVLEDGTVLAWERATFLDPEPSLDADVLFMTLGTEGRRSVRYEGELLVAKDEMAIDGVLLLSERHGYTPEGAPAWSWTWSSRAGVGTLVTFSYDAQGHLIETVSGVDVDEDGLHDGATSSQTWDWACD